MKTVEIFIMMLLWFFLAGTAAAAEKIKLRKDAVTAAGQQTACRL